MEYCLVGELSQEEQREKGLYTVSRLSVFEDPDEYMPKLPFKDFDWSKVPGRGHDLQQFHRQGIRLEPPPPHHHDLRQFRRQGIRLEPPPPHRHDLHQFHRKGIRLEPPPPPQKRRRTPINSIEERDMVLKMKRELYAAQGKCLTGSPLSPFCQCSKLGGASSSCCRPPDTPLTDMPLPAGAFEEHRHNIVPIWLAYLRQTRQSHCFDVDHHPGSCIFGGASITPLPPSRDFNNKAKLPMQLAHLAIQEYNEKKCNVFKYQVLKIEKVNLAKEGNSFQYWMTVKVLNLTLATPIETFQVHGLVFLRKYDNKFIQCFRPKEEEIVGLPSCDVCFGKLRREEEPLGLEEGAVRKGELPDKFLVHLNRWNDDDFIPKAASMENREAFRRIYGRYFRQIFQSDGFDLDIYPGDAKEAVYIPYLDFEKEADMLMEVANHAILDYNNRETSVYKYKVSYIEKVNFSVAECREFYMTIKVINLTLRTPLETFQIHAYKGLHEENVVRLCRKKMLI